MKFEVGFSSVCGSLWTREWRRASVARMTPFRSRYVIDGLGSFFNANSLFFDDGRSSLPIGLCCLKR